MLVFGGITAVHGTRPAFSSFLRHTSGSSKTTNIKPCSLTKALTLFTEGLFPTPYSRSLYRQQTTIGYGTQSTLDGTGSFNYTYLFQRVWHCIRALILLFELSSTLWLLYFSLSFSILAVFFLMAACHLPCRRPLAWLMHLQRHPVFRFAPCSLDAFADAIGVLATRFRTIFRRLLSSGHRLCLSGWVVVAALVGSPCWIVVAYLN